MTDTGRDDGEQWSELWDLHYDLAQEVDALIKAKFGIHPPLWRSMAQMFLIEHLAESARFDVELPPAKAPDQP